MPKNLEELFYGVEYEAVPNKKLKGFISGISYNSKEVKADYIFFALKGTAVDGQTFIDEAIKNGARVVVADMNFKQKSPVLLIKVAEPRKVLGLVAKRFFDDPTKNLTIVGVTGTNGKTTTSYLVQSILNQTGLKTGLVGTIAYDLGRKTITAKNTTPESLDLFQLFKEMVEVGLTHAVIEVSSHALAFHRVDQIPFQVGVFTNLTRDHLDFHKTFEEYKIAKLQFFYLVKKEGVVVYNLDDPVGAEIEKIFNGKLISYGIKNVLKTENFVTARSASVTNKETKFTIYHNADSYTITSPLLGRHNIYNLLAAYSVGIALNIQRASIISGMESLNYVPGRLMPVPNNKNLSVFVDYAHTDDALKNVLVSTREFTAGKIIVVFGCGGNRDQGKRPMMGKVATEYADFAIITSDNPRQEDPQAIVADILNGIDKENYIVLLNRQEAIAEAIRRACPQDSVIIAGKGHETYQIVKDQVRDFDDFKVAKECLN